MLCFLKEKINKKILSLLLAALMALATPAFSDETEQAKALGESLSREALDILGTKEGMTERIKKPVMSGETPMKTLKPTYRCSTSGVLFSSITECQDRCTGECEEYGGFNAQLQCPSAVEFLKITILPSAGNDFNLIVSQDTNLDGETDHAFQMDGVSGVCTHGLVTCNPGTWNNCTYYLWAVDENGHITLSETEDDRTQAGQCYCVNNSCGGILTSIIESVLQDLGTGASTVLAEARDIAVSKAEVDLSEYSIRFYGQSSSECQHIADTTYEEGSSAGRTSPQALKQSYKSGYLPVQEEITSQSQNPESYYSQLSNSTALNEGHRGCFCKIMHDFTAQEVIHDPQTGRVGNEGNDYWGGGEHTREFHINVAAGYYVTYAEMTPYYDDYARVFVNGHLVYDNWCGTSGNPSCSYDWCKYHPCPRGNTFTVENPQNLFHEGDNVITFVVWVVREGEGWLDYSITMASQEYMAVSEDTCNTPDGCESKPECTLMDVQICDYAGNCIYTLRNGESTGKTPVPTCKAFMNKKTKQQYSICTDGTQMTSTNVTTGETTVLVSGSDVWWMVKKRYDCEEHYSYQADFNRSKTAASTVNADTGTYQDLSLGTQSIPLNQFPPDHEQYKCEMSCAVTKISTDTTSYYTHDENKATATTSATMKEYIIKRCIQDQQGNWHCPLEPGETHYRPEDAECGCIDMFPEAASAMQAVYEASKDMICSSDEP